MEDNFIYKARAAALKRMPYIGHILYYLRPMPTDKVSIAGVSKSGVLYYNPEKCAAVDEEGLVFIFLHEAFHIFQDTHKREGNKDHYRWNIASDTCINDMLEGEGIPLPHIPTENGEMKLCIPRAYGLPRFKSSEYYYEHLPENVKTVFVDLVDFDEDEARSTEDTEIARRICAIDVKKYSDEHGHVPEGLLRELSELIEPPKRDWRKIFRSKVRYITNQAVAGKYDYSYQKLPRRESDIIMPGLLSYDAKLGILLDTSGSIDEHLLNECMAQVRHISKLFGEAWFVSIDAEVQTFFKVKKYKDLFKSGSVKGGGGTVLGPGFEKLKEKGINVCVAISDCYADFGEDPKFPVVWVCKTGSHGDPPWGTVIEIE